MTNVVLFFVLQAKCYMEGRCMVCLWGKREEGRERVGGGQGSVGGGGGRGGGGRRREGGERKGGKDCFVE